MSTDQETFKTIGRGPKTGDAQLCKGVLGLAVTAAVLAANPAQAGGLFLYEFGTAEPGLAAAGYAARAQDASTAFTNPAGMTRLDDTQVMAGGQLMWFNTSFTPGEGTSPGLGTSDGGRALGSDGFVPGGSAFVTHRMSEDIVVGVSVVGNFGSIIDYDDDWVGRYRVQEGTLIGIQVVPSIAWQATETVSLGAGINAMYGTIDQRVAVNNLNPNAADGSLELDDNTWGYGFNVGLLWDFSDDIRVGVTYASEIDLDFRTRPQFSNIGPALTALLDSRGLLDANVDLGATVPQQFMTSIVSRINEEWQLLANIGWQDWSSFGEVEIGIDDPNNPTSLTTALDFKDTWHGAVGAQHNAGGPWTINFGIAYDSAFQESGQVSPLFPANAAWRFGVGGEQQVNDSFRWGVTGSLILGGSPGVNAQSALPPQAGGRGSLVGEYEDTLALAASVYGNWSF
jgi:long-chain fatty acid transport protein